MCPGAYEVYTWPEHLVRTRRGAMPRNSVERHPSTCNFEGSVGPKLEFPKIEGPRNEEYSSLGTLGFVLHLRKIRK